MKDLRRVPFLAIALIVILRMSIGWQFLYEGMWKRSTLNTPEPWTSEGYLKTAQGPMRDYFRDLVGDPDELGWLDYETMSRRWYDWRDRFVAHYQLTEEQANRLNRLLDGSADEDSPPAETPPTPSLWQTLTKMPTKKDPKTGEQVPINPSRIVSSISYNAEQKQLSVAEPITPREEGDLYKLVDVTRAEDGSYTKRSDIKQEADATDLEFYETIQKLAKQSRELSFRHKLAGVLKGNPEFAGVTAQLNERGSFDSVMETRLADEETEDRFVITYGKIQEYKDLLADYERSLKQAKIDYQYEHATMLGRKVAIMKAELTGPVKELDRSLRDAAQKILTADQLKMGAMPPAESPLAQADSRVLWGLLILGTLLIVGFFTRGAALLGAVMLFSFYMVSPPWPGVPPAPGPEHSLIINKNLIESFALLAIAAMPTGTWFGIDGLFYSLWRGRKTKEPVKATS